MSDLLLIIALNVGLLGFGGLLKVPQASQASSIHFRLTSVISNNELNVYVPMQMVVVDPFEKTPEGFWANIYDVRAAHCTCFLLTCHIAIWLTSESLALLLADHDHRLRSAAARC